MGGHAAAWGLMTFLVSRSCLERGPLPRARRPELVPAPAAGFSGPGNRSEGLPALGCPSPPVSTQASFPKFSQSRELSLPLLGVCRYGLPHRLLLLPSKVDLGCRNNPQPLEELSCCGLRLAILERSCRGPAAWDCHRISPGPLMAEGGTGGVPGTVALTASWQRAAPASWRVSQAVRSCLSGSVHPDNVQVAKVDALLVEPGAAGATSSPQVGASGPGQGRWLLWDGGGSSLALAFVQGHEQG